MAVRVQNIDNRDSSVPYTESSNDDLYAPPPEDVHFSHQIVRHEFPREVLDEDATKVVRRLARFGHDAYLVGGCVRDLLFGQKPKDFDVATSALPGEIRKIFRNCRLIGRRFRLAHLFFRNQKIIEVATFRRGATSDDDISSRHAAENLFGGPADDAIRRDFSINALMYDMERREIHDFVGGLADVDARVLNTIGDPNRRFPEDPVRIIRAVKFAVRLDLQLDPAVEKAARTHAPTISDCAPARLVEEMYKILRTGKATRCIREMHRLGALAPLMPNLAKRIDDDAPEQSTWRVLERADKQNQSGKQLSDALMLACLAYPHCSGAYPKKGDLSAKIHDQLLDIFAPMTFPKRCIATVRQLLVAQRRLQTGPVTKRARRILDRDYAQDAIELMSLIAEDDEQEKLCAEWRRALGRRPRPKANNQRRCDRRPPRRRRRHSRNENGEPQTNARPRNERGAPPRSHPRQR